MTLLSLITFSLAVFCYAIKELQSHGKLKWTNRNKPKDFWGEESWTRKYSKTDVFNSPDNWYYRFFKISVKERFPLSATLLVFLTDGYHLAQLTFKLLLVVSIVMYRPLFGWWDALIYFVVWGIAFTITYKSLSR